MEKKLIVEIAEGLGNQFFMYAHAFSMAKKLNYDLFIDHKSAYSLKKNTLRDHQKYMLDSFNIAQNYAPTKYIYDTKTKRILKKFAILIDNYKDKKIFFIEKKTKINNSKKFKNYNNLSEYNFSDNIYVQGNFENYRYFNQYKDELSNFFVSKKKFENYDNSLIDKLSSSNSISIHIRRNRFSDQIGLTEQ